MLVNELTKKLRWYLRWEYWEKLRQYINLVDNVRYKEYWKKKVITGYWDINGW